MKKFNYQIYGNIKSIVKFEITSLLGRTFKRSKSKIPLNKTPVLLDLGVGTNYTEGWLHADFFVIRFRFWEKPKKVRMPDIELDLGAYSN